MAKLCSFLKYWLPVAAWIGVTFTASADTHSYQHSSRLLEPLLRWLFPHISEHALGLWLLVARKCAHLTEYAILGMFLWRALRKPARADPRPWSWRTAGWAIALAAGCAASDEFHQRFVPTRDPAVHDVVIDTVGATLGILFIWAVRRALKQREVRRLVPAAQPSA